MAVEGKNALARGLEVLQLEADAIRTLRGRIGASFEQAVAWILDCRGTVVVTGMGKAGLIGQKISATLASTGTPSLSLHPAEALHGDLGRVRAADLVLALSKSGKTVELLRLLPPLKALGARVIALTESADSPLAAYADLTIAMGPLGEACPLGLAPTVTTTALLALGDALAMAVLEGRDFTREEFAAFHPAGDLGRSLMKVGEIMRRGAEVPLLEAGRSVRAALEVMTSTPGRPGAALIVGPQRELRGIFTDGDLRRLAASPAGIALDDPIDAHMARAPRFVRAGQLTGEALRLLRDHHIDQAPVLADDGDAVVGLIDVQDLLEVRL